MSLPAFLAWPHDTGVIGGFVATAVLGVPAYIRSHIRADRRHQAVLAQRERHHAEAEANAAARHNARLHQAERHQQQRLDQAEAHHKGAPGGGKP